MIGLVRDILKYSKKHSGETKTPKTMSLDLGVPKRRILEALCVLRGSSIYDSHTNVLNMSLTIHVRFHGIIPRLTVMTSAVCSILNTHDINTEFVVDDFSWLKVKKNDERVLYDALNGLTGAKILRQWKGRGKSHRYILLKKPKIIHIEHCMPSCSINLRRSSRIKTT